MKPISRVRRSKGQAQKAYDRMSRWYDLVAGGFESRHRVAGLQMLNAASGEAILEIGVGTGHSLQALAEAVGEEGKVCGLDLSTGMLAEAKGRLEKAKMAERVSVALGDGARLPFESGCFDGIFMSFTLELFDTPEIPRVLAECRRVLCDGGRICVVAMSKEGKESAMTRLYERLHEIVPAYADCRPIYAEEAIREVGFHIREVEVLSLFGLRDEVVLGEKR